MKPSNLKSGEFRLWRMRHGFSKVTAARILGVSSNSVDLYENGFRRDNGVPVVIPKTVAWACSAITANLKPLGEE